MRGRLGRFWYLYPTDLLPEGATKHIASILIRGTGTVHSELTGEGVDFPRLPGCGWLPLVAGRRPAVPGESDCANLLRA